MGAGLAVLAGDDRITPLGHTLRRLSLDELPQLLEHRARRHEPGGPAAHRGRPRWSATRPTSAAACSPAPGLTGLAQVSGRNTIPWSERIEIDVTYVDRWTMRRDLAIMLRTALVVLRREGTYKGPRGGFDLPGPGAADG